ncbi:MAG: hypothetical protein K0R08_2193 [Solimicrobium sp.]|jgi:hypothetical protein|nr:hypothetical protein [Solimicrobium sp.]
MKNEFDLAIDDLGVVIKFNDVNLAKFALQREDNSEILITLYRDVEHYLLRMTAHTSRTIPSEISPEFFTRFAQSALEPLRGGIGIGMSEGARNLCVYYALPLQHYVQGQSLTVLESLVEKVEEWDALLISQP